MKYQIQNVHNDPMARYGSALYDSYKAAEQRIKEVEGFDPDANIDQFTDNAQISICPVIPEDELERVCYYARLFAREDAFRQGLSRIDDDAIDASADENCMATYETYFGSTPTILAEYKKAYRNGLESVKREHLSHRYTIHFVTDQSLKEWNETPVDSSDDKETAKQLAKDWAGNTGTVVVDHQEKTVDWGVQITKIGEPCTWEVPE